MSNTRMKIQRLARREEKEIIRRIVSLSVISIILAVVLFTAGITLLGKFTDLLGTVFTGKEDAPSSEVSLQPPVLDELPESTNSASLKVSGFISSGDKVEVYHDDALVGEAEISGSQFEYDDVTLKNGENRINAKAISGETVSDASETVLITLDKTEPKLEIESPTEEQTFVGNNRIKVNGKTDKDAQVYAMGFLASVDFDGNFEVFVPITEGESTIEIKAVDSAGNTKIEKRKVTFRK